MNTNSLQNDIEYPRPGVNILKHRKLRSELEKSSAGPRILLLWFYFKETFVIQFVSLPKWSYSESTTSRSASIHYNCYSLTDFLDQVGLLFFIKTQNSTP